MSSLPEQADLLDDSHPSDANFQRENVSINAKKALLSANSSSIRVAKGDVGTKTQLGSVICQYQVDQLKLILLSLRFQRPWEWPPCLQIFVFFLASITVFGVTGYMPYWFDAVSLSQQATPAPSPSSPVLKAMFEQTSPTLGFNVFSPSTSGVFMVLSFGMLVLVLILFAML